MSALDEYPRELLLSSHRTRKGIRWTLEITAPDISGEVISSSEDVILGIAEAYAAMRRDLEAS